MSDLDLSLWASHHSTAFARRSLRRSLDLEVVVGELRESSLAGEVAAMGFDSGADWPGLVSDSGREPGGNSLSTSSALIEGSISATTDDGMAVAIIEAAFLIMNAPSSPSTST